MSAYEYPEKVTDEAIATYIRPHPAGPERTRQLVDFILGFNNAQTVRVERLVRKLAVPRSSPEAQAIPFFPLTRPVD